MGRKFTILIDQKSQKFLTGQRLLAEDQFKWTSKLMGFDFDIVYKPGCENKAADALSRRMTYSAISMIRFSDEEEWESEVLADPKLKKIMQDLLVNGSAHPGYSLQDKKIMV